MKRSDLAVICIIITGILGALLGVFLTVLQLFACAALGLYRSFRRTRLRRELSRLWLSS